MAILSRARPAVQAAARQCRSVVVINTSRARSMYLLAAAEMVQQRRARISSIVVFAATSSSPPHRRSAVLCAAAAADSGASTTVTIKVTGMVCDGCSGRVEAALKAVPGVAAASVDLAAATATVQGDAQPSALVALIKDLGFDASLQ